MSSDDQSEKECPLCMEPLELDDVNFYPCKCEYQICRFCWHRLRTDENEANGLCPACRQPYPEDPVNFKPLSTQELQRIKSEKKQKAHAQRQRLCDSRKHLANYRVLQKNLVYVIGLSARVAEPETLKKPEFFGRYGRIHKVVVGQGGPLAQAQAANTAYVTYTRAEDALRAIQAVNNAQLDGRVVKASLGTTKYCSSFLRSQPCHKPECMYLHDVADMEVSFTKDDMHLGRHAEYEKKLSEQLLGPSSSSKATSVQPSNAVVNKTSTQRNVHKHISKSAERCAPIARPNGKERSQGVVNRKEKNNGADIKTTEETMAQINVVHGLDQRCLSQINVVPDSSCQSVIDSRQRSEALPVPGSEVTEPVSRSKLFSSWSTSSTPLVKGGTCDSVEKLLVGVSPPPCDWQRALGISSITPPPSSAVNSAAFVHSDDDLGFDPFNESSKGLADLLEQERRASIASPMVVDFRRGASPHFSPNQPTTVVYNSSMLGNRGQMPMHDWGMNNGGGMSSWSSPGPMASLHRGTSSSVNSFNRPPPGLMTTGPLRHPQSSTSASTSLLGQSQISPTSALNEWQEGLKALLPNVNVHFAPDLSSSSSHSHQHHHPWNGTGLPPGPSPFSQPPPPPIGFNGYGWMPPPGFPSR